ncbi:MAG: hypothetical protein OXE81_05955, partial [Gammaproteobacteria bacterium]|nr:hypothetical protein [Gammaproteobacteria bacterium]
PSAIVLTLNHTYLWDRTLYLFPTSCSVGQLSPSKFHLQYVAFTLMESAVSVERESEASPTISRHAGKTATMTGIRSVFLNPTDEERGYFGMIDKAAAMPSNEIISNGKPAHAVYLVHKFLESAQHTVKICTGRLARHMGGVLAYADPRIAEAAIRFLGKEDSELTIMVIDSDGVDVDVGQDEGQHPLILALDEARSGIVGKWKVLRRNSNIPSLGIENHFMVKDGTAVRIEVDTDRAEAYVNFEDEKFGETLSSIFGLLQAEDCWQELASSHQAS